MTAKSKSKPLTKREAAKITQKVQDTADLVMKEYFRVRRRVTRLVERERTLTESLREAFDKNYELERRMNQLVSDHEEALQQERTWRLAVSADTNLADLILDGVSVDEKFNTWPGCCCSGVAHHVYLGCYMKKGHSLYFCKACCQIYIWGVVTKRVIDYRPCDSEYELCNLCESSMLALFLAKRSKLI